MKHFQRRLSKPPAYGVELSGQGPDGGEDTALLVHPAAGPDRTATAGAASNKSLLQAVPAWLRVARLWFQGDATMPACLLLRSDQAPTTGSDGVRRYRRREVAGLRLVGCSHYDVSCDDAAPGPDILCTERL